MYSEKKKKKVKKKIEKKNYKKIEKKNIKKKSFFFLILFSNDYINL